MTQEILNAYGPIGVDVLKQNVALVSATQKTMDSIRYEVEPNRLLLIARGYFAALETGRGPRKSSEPGTPPFEDSMLEYMKARGIGADLPEKKRKQLARFLTYKINKEGDSLWKKGHGSKVRDVYSFALDRFVNELSAAIKKDLMDEAMNKIHESLHGINARQTA